MKTTPPRILIAATIHFLLTIAPARAEIVLTNLPIDPRSTYLHACASDQSVDAVPIPLASLGVRPGDVLGFRALGAFSFGAGDPGESASGMLGIFSSSSTLRAKIQRDRVADAIESGPDWVSGVSRPCGDQTDIPQDFFIPTGGVVVPVPTNAVYLFVSAGDNQFDDNHDRNGDYVFQITRECGLCMSISFALPEVRVCWSSESNTLYRVEFTAALTNDTWRLLAENVVGDGNTNCVPDTAAENQRFYRVIRQP